MHWIYYLLGVVVVIAAFLAYVMYRGYNKVKPQPVKGIPCPPMTHAILGHPDKMLHPLKHELRLEVCESARAPVHQLVLMKHASVFVNDANEAARLLSDLPDKGPIYHAFRYDPSVPDLLASDGEEYASLRTALQPSLLSLSLSLSEEDLDLFMQKLKSQLEKARGGAGERKAVNIEREYTLLSFDLVSQFIFNFNLGASEESERGLALYACLQTFSDHVNSQGIYALPSARKVTPEQVQAAREQWKAFLLSLLEHIKATPQPSPLLQALLTLEEKEGLAGVVSEIHSLFRHGYEMLSSSMMWCTYVLAKHKAVRSKLEASLLQKEVEYVECVLKEVLRRYPSAGNLTVRTSSLSEEMLLGGYEVPKGVPIHIHMFSLHNTSREWERPKDFLPERWTGREGGRLSPPSCPFAKGGSSSGGAVYEGAGFREGSLSFFPFSAGARSCPMKHWCVAVLKAFLRFHSTNFHLNFADRMWDDDLGASLHATLMPMQALHYKVVRILDLERVVKKEAGGLEEEEGEREAEEGWAKEEEE